MQRAKGHVATIGAGQIMYRDGDPTGALPGRLRRGARGKPVRREVAAWSAAVSAPS
jgi:N-acyl-D-aspartate/D-glutamate deacylase